MDGASLGKEPLSARPDPEDVTRVDVERMDGEAMSTSGGGGFDHREIMAPPPSPGLISVTWCCLLLAWFFFASQVPFTVILAIPLNLAALVLALTCLMRGGLKTGVLVLLLGTVGSFIIYMVSLSIFVVGAVA